MPVVVIVNALRANRLGTSFAKIVNDFCGMLRARYTFDTSMNNRLSVICFQEVDKLRISPTIARGLFLYPHPASWASFHMLGNILILLLGRKVLWHLFHSLVVAIDNLHQTRATKCASTVVQYQRRSEVQWFKPLFFPLLIDGGQIHKVLNSVERLRAVVAKQNVIHFMNYY